MTKKLFEWINRHPRVTTAAIVLLALTLGVIGPRVANTDEPSFDPAGEIYDIAARADETLTDASTIAEATFLVESADGGDVLTAAALDEWKQATDRIRSDTELSAPLVTGYDPDTGTSSTGIASIADVVEAELASGLGGATDAEVKSVLADLFADGSPMAGLRLGLSEATTAETAADGSLIWSSPAFTASVTYDRATFDSGSGGALWLREVQAEVQAAASLTDPIGVAIDEDVVFEEQIEASAPFIFLAVALVVLLVAAVHRSYWSSVIVASGLGATMLAYYGIAALVGLQMGSLLLSFIVPIAMISFGVDFYIHGTGRVREMQVEAGLSSRVAYPAAMRAVFTAMLLAALSSVAAFLSNAISGTEAIVEFGIGAAIALALAYVILGLIAPRVLIGIEDFIGANPIKGAARWIYRIGLVPVAIIGGLAVTLAAVQPAIGVFAVAAVLPVLIGGPAMATRRRNRRAFARARAISTAIPGNAHGLQSAGSFVHALASRRIVTVPAIAAIGVLSVFTAFQVESGFELTDFISSKIDFVQSIERIDDHFPSNGGGGGFVYAEGDLTDPATLMALDRVVADVEASGAEFGRDAAGALQVGAYATDLVRSTMSNPDAIRAIEASGTTLSDADANGIPDSAAGVAAVYDHIATNGVLDADGNVIYAADDTGDILAFLEDGGQATAVWIGFASFTDAEVIRPAWDALEAAADTLESTTEGLGLVGVSGGVITQFDSLEAFSRSMVVSLPLAILLTLIVAAVVLRSLRYAIASVIPIGFVVAGVYAFMTVVDFKINIVTATIAAIAVGVGIDFSTHFTARFREELETAPSRLAALRTAGEGTGGALVLSALSSIMGFTVMAFAPTPIFATFGVLTAVMIAMALFASLAILPTVLLAVTPKQQDRALPGITFDEEQPLAA